MSSFPQDPLPVSAAVRADRREPARIHGLNYRRVPSPTIITSNTETILT